MIFGEAAKVLKAAKEHDPNTYYLINAGSRDLSLEELENIVNPKPEIIEEEDLYKETTVKDLWVNVEEDPFNI